MFFADNNIYYTSPDFKCTVISKEKIAVRGFFPALLTTGVILENGGTDAPNAVSTCVASGVLSPRRASAIAAGCNFFGALISGLFFPSVARTVEALGGLSASPDPLSALTGAMLAVLLWTGAAWLLSIPTSESHGLLAALAGASLWGAGFGQLSLKAWAAVFAGMVGSVAGGWLCGAAAKALLFRRAPKEKLIGRAQIAAAALAAALHGAQDGQKFMCILALSQSFASGNPAQTELSPQTVIWCAFVLAAGTALCGRKMLGIASSLGIETRTEGLAADIGGAAVLLFATALGLPVSTTHVKTASAAGAGSGEKGTLARLAAAWLLTFPVCGLLGYVLVPLVKALLL